MQKVVYRVTVRMQPELSFCSETSSGITLDRCLLAFMLLRRI